MLGRGILRLEEHEVGRGKQIFTTYQKTGLLLHGRAYPPCSSIERPEITETNLFTQTLLDCIDGQKQASVLSWWVMLCFLRLSALISPRVYTTSCTPNQFPITLQFQVLASPSSSLPRIRFWRTLLYASSLTDYPS